MLKKTITFVDFDGNTVSEDHYFNLSKTELAEMELTTEGGLTGQLEAIAERMNGREIIDTFTDLIKRSYGQRVSNSRFAKSEEISNEFLQTLAYDALFTELITDPGAAAKFLNAVVPADLKQTDEKIQEVVAKQVETVNLPVREPGQALEAAPKDLNEMSREELLEHMRQTGVQR